ncbi:MAG: sugar transferase [Lachnospiraceae bacterium]|nr:sugar transferase [Lachnospiraceae bacterium]
MYRKKAGGWLKHLDFILLDIICMQAAFLLAYAVRMGPSNPYRDIGYREIGAIILLAEVVVLLLTGAFSGVLKRGRYEEFSATLSQALFVEAVVIAALFTTQTSADYSRFIIYLTGILYVCISYFVRLIWKAFLRRYRAGADQRSLLLVTYFDLAKECAADIMEHGSDGLLITGFAILDQNMKGKKIQGIPVVAGPDDVVDAVCRSWVDEALVVLPRELPYPGRLVEELAGMGVVAHVSVFRTEDSNGMRQFVEHVGGHTVLTTSISYATPTQQFIKRSMDIAGGIVGCAITGILLMILAPAIFIASPGPVFFTQERVGMNGKRFRIFKFRSMYMDAEERKKELIEKIKGDGLMFKMEGDPRIIGCKVLPDGTVKKGLGNLIRDWSLDEFPQFFNVLKGDMSLVGTRPPTVDEWERYEPHHRARLAVRPGITGLWQVSGRSKITDFEEVVKLDTKYITDWSMGLDIRILLKTVKVVFGRDGAM